MMTMTSCMAVFFAVAGITAVRSRNATAYTDHEGTGGISVEPHTEVPDRRVSTLV
jgi:hypothetical protein